MNEVLVEETGGVLTCRINRPHRRNAVTLEVLNTLGDLLLDVERRPEVRVFVLTGVGGSFCAGADLQQEATDPQVMMPVVSALCSRLHHLDRPTIAAVPGAAVGFGFNLALCCDLVICGDDAVFRQGFTTVGLSIDGGGSWLLPRLVGAAAAKQLLFDDARIGAAEAQALGLVNEVVPAGDLDTRVRERAARLATGPTLALARTKQLINASMDGSFEEALEAEARCQVILAGSHDAAEGRRAFQERRTPRFEGR